MRTDLCLTLAILVAIGGTSLTTPAYAQPPAGVPAVKALGRDFAFPHAIAGLPASLSAFSDLQINRFTTSDGVELAYWEAGSGKSLIFVPAWSASGANYINVLYLLRTHYHVYVLDPRDQGLSARTCRH